MRRIRVGRRSRQGWHVADREGKEGRHDRDYKCTSSISNRWSPFGIDESEEVKVQSSNEDVCL
jgi:hypothetical protein